MRNFMELKMIVGQQVVEGSGEDDTDALPAVQDVTCLVSIDPEQVRNFYPRKGERVGTRILFRNGSALAVANLYEDVKTALRGSQ